MTNGFYLTIVLIVSFLAMATGFRRGITRQPASLMGFGFGAVAARVLTPGVAQHFAWVDLITPAPEFNDFAANLVCGVTIYFIVYWLFSLMSPVLIAALSVFEIGIVNRIIGAFFSLIKNLLWLSIIFNLLICFKDNSGLLQYEQANDGNLVSAVMSLTPGILGCYGAEDFAHFHQLKEAKKISRNIMQEKDVIKIAYIRGNEFCNKEFGLERCANKKNDNA